MIGAWKRRRGHLVLRSCVNGLRVLVIAVAGVLEVVLMGRTRSIWEFDRVSAEKD